MRMVPVHLVEVEELQGDPRWDLVQRIARSSGFRNSARLKDFLFYVTACAIRQTPEEATEQQIGIFVFGRRPGFNSADDSIVRTQARLLRQKLAYYFESEANVDLWVGIPKGHYLPVFTSGPELRSELPQESALRPMGASSASTTQEEESHAGIAELESQLSFGTTTLPAGRSVSARLRPWRLWVGVALIAICLTLAGFIGGRTTLLQKDPAPEVSKLWAPFLKGEPPLVVYSNASFVGDSTTGLKYANAETEANHTDKIVDYYTGTGELAAVHDITQLFDRHGAEFLLKRSHLMTWDEARGHNLIFLGSIAENASLKVLPRQDDFPMFADPDEAGFLNLTPAAGEPGRYSRTEKRPLQKDYAVVALRPGMEPSLRTFALSGLTTLGTEAAAEFALNRSSAAQLLKAATVNGEVHPFQALLEVEIREGVPLQTRIVALRVH